MRVRKESFFKEEGSEVYEVYEVLEEYEGSEMVEEYEVTEVYEVYEVFEVLWNNLSSQGRTFFTVATKRGLSGSRHPNISRNGHRGFLHISNRNPAGE